MVSRPWFSGVCCFTSQRVFVFLRGKERKDWCSQIGLHKNIDSSLGII